MSHKSYIQETEDALFDLVMYGDRGNPAFLRKVLKGMLSRPEDRLIAAAPKLLEALKYVRGYLEERNDWLCAKYLIEDIDKALKGVL